MKVTVDTLLKSMECIGILIADTSGTITHVDETFESYYGISTKELHGKSVYDLETANVFTPSVVAKVIENGKPTTIIQKLRNNEEVIVTGFPLYDGGGMTQIITFSRDINTYRKLKSVYEELHKKIDIYKKTIEALSCEASAVEDMETSNDSFKKLLTIIQRVAKYDINILLLGETGVGKTLIAKKIHALSNCANGRFIEINCGAVPEQLIESELFGYEKGAFTSASEKGKPGLFEIANDGTLFLDEISELPISSQTKLLKVLQDGQVRRIGSTEDVKINFRLICATNKDLDEEVSAGGFRQDLLYRLNAVTFTIPPLKKRKEDIFLYANSFLEKANAKYSLCKVFDASVKRAFMCYDWPGNVRELENTVYRAAVVSEHDSITEDDLPGNIRRQARGDLEYKKCDMGFSNTINDLNAAVESYEAEIIRRTYKRAPSSIKLGKALNISQSTAARKIRKYLKS